jgi:hypothetical protein
LTRHLQLIHPKEELVAEAMKLPKKDKDKAFDNIRKLGIHQHNTTILTTGSGNSLLRDRITVNSVNTIDDANMKMCCFYRYIHSSSQKGIKANNASGQI